MKFTAALPGDQASLLAVFFDLCESIHKFYLFAM